MYKAPPIYEIPLILHLICSTLYAKDIANCVLVSKTWRDLFSPYLFRNIDDQYEPDFKEWTALEGGLERLLLNAQHIRKLALFDARLALILQGSRCKHLTRLRIREHMPRLASNAVMRLVERNPQLEELLLDHPIAERDEQRLFAALPNLHRLKKISVDMIWPGARQILENLPDSVEVLACGPYVLDYDQEWLEDQDEPNHPGHHDQGDEGDLLDFDGQHGSDDDGQDSLNSNQGTDDDGSEGDDDSSDMDDDEYDSDGQDLDHDFEELANSIPPEQLLQMMNGALDEAEHADSDDEDMHDDGHSDVGSEDSDMYDSELAFKDEKVVDYKDPEDNSSSSNSNARNIHSGKGGPGGGGGAGGGGGGSNGKGSSGPLDRTPNDGDNKRRTLTGLYLDFVLGSDDMLQFLPMLRRFPNLEHFGVPHASDGNLAVLSRVLRRHCPKIDSLSITQRWNSDVALTTLLNDRVNLKQLKIRPPMSFVVRTEATLSLLTHAWTLERIDVFGVRFASDDIQTILSTCSNLISLRLSPYSDPKEPEHSFGSVGAPSGSLTFYDMTRGDWSCKKLKFLSIRLSDYFGFKVVKKVTSKDADGNGRKKENEKDKEEKEETKHDVKSEKSKKNKKNKKETETDEEETQIEELVRMELTEQDRKEMIEKVYRQLGRLHRLEMLEIGVFHEQVMEPEQLDEPTDGDEPEEQSDEIEFMPSESGMDFSLGSGLDHLRGLKNLECLRLLFHTESNALSRLKEAQWMAEHWPKLQYLDGVSPPVWNGIVEDDHVDDNDEDEVVAKSKEPAGYEYLKSKLPNLVIRELWTINAGISGSSDVGPTLSVHQEGFTIASTAMVGAASRGEQLQPPTHRSDRDQSRLEEGWEWAAGLVGTFERLAFTPEVPEGASIDFQRGLGLHLVG
ncbi:hypothetical protein BG004_007119, partial [Podila humilis]